MTVWFFGHLAAIGKAIALNAELRYCPCREPLQVNQEQTLGAREVDVTIGLFTIIKLFRLVNLTVESKGFCIPRECEEVSQNPCEFFERLEFPLNIFEPPSRGELRSEGLGISEREDREERGEFNRNCRCDRP